ncbi:MAG: hypothetical protein M1832_004851 [Thelocarpon impressellum]|nr:MAG: hypothetical protein M1832_004851 [Thelocarpon impressellum]
MCNYQYISYLCGHHEYRLLSHCHFARNDPNHQCFGVKTCKRETHQQMLCWDCTVAAEGRGLGWNSLQGYRLLSFAMGGSLVARGQMERYEGAQLIGAWADVSLASQRASAPGGNV